MLASFFSTSCPSCGAKVDVQSPTSVTVVCKHCYSTLILKDQGLAISGRHSAVLEDYSALQIGSTGIIRKNFFQVIGRLQVQYESIQAYDLHALPAKGSWNEWYIQFFDGKHAWLSESNGHFVFTEEKGEWQNSELPSFSGAKAGVSLIKYSKRDFLVSDVREAQRVKNAAEGELPFLLKDDQNIKVVDARHGNAFMTLDYTDNEDVPVLFAGFGVSLDNLNMANLRSLNEVKDKAGHIRGEISKSDCPHCGATVSWLPGRATHVNCEYCGSQIEFQDEKVQLVVANDMRSAQDRNMAIKIGQTARIDKRRWVVMGMICQSEIRAGDAYSAVMHGRKRQGMHAVGDMWYEYLLFSYPDTFRWLVQTSNNEWYSSHTLNQWPKLNYALEPLNSHDKPLPKLYQYGGRVEFAAGAFYWQVCPNDITLYTDYGNANNKIGSEVTGHDMNWSRVVKVDNSKVLEWFNLKELGGQWGKFKSYSADAFPKHSKPIAIGLIVLYCLLNLPVLVGMEEIDSFLIISAIVIAILWLPLYSGGEDD